MRQEKIPTQAFTAKDLPKTRAGMFADVMKNDFFLVVNVSVLCGLFALPLLILSGVLTVLLSGAASAENVYQSTTVLCFWGGIFSVPCLACLYWGLKGGYAVITKRVFGCGGYVKTDFFAALRDGGKCALVGATVGVSATILICAALLLLPSNADGIAKGLGIGVAVTQFMIAVTAGDYFLSQQCVYKLNFRDCMRNSLAFVFARFAPNFLGFVMFTALPIALCFLAIWLEIAVCALAATVATGVAILTKTLYAQSVFDEYINKDNYPDCVKRGLYKG